MSTMMPANGTMWTLLLCKQPFAEKRISDREVTDEQFTVYIVTILGL